MVRTGRPIDERNRPPVAGIDLVQALNYIQASAAGVEFCYDHYTNSNLIYTRGARPQLEAVADSVTRGCATPLDKVRAIAKWVQEKLPWAGFYRKATGRPLPTDRAMTEEGLIESGYGWCNEQARVFCCLTQIVGIASRLVFAGNPERKYGHVTAEALLPEGWMAVDPTLGFCFIKDGRPVRAVDVFGDAACRAYFGPIYKRLCTEMGEIIGRDLLCDMFRSENPLDGFAEIGFHNHFVF